jgi:hypothetical protein
VLASDLLEMDFIIHPEDTALSWVHTFYKSRYHGNSWLDLGLMGSPSYFPGADNVWGEHMTMGSNPVEIYEYRAAGTKHYAGEEARTDLQYAQGAGDLIYLKAEHAQNIFDRWTFGLDYTRLKTNNVYYGNWSDFTKVRMNNMYNTRLYSHFYTQNRKYEVLSSFTWNKNRLAETGGISQKGRFDSLAGRDKYFFNNSNLSDAYTQFSNTHWQVIQLFRDGKRQIAVGDSFVKDSSTTNIKSQWYHQMDWRMRKELFTDETSDETYYPVLLYANATNDSMHTLSISNRFGRQYYLGKLMKLNHYGQYEFAALSQNPGYLGYRKKFNNILLGTQIMLGDSAKHINVLGEIAPMGYYAGDFRVEGLAKVRSEALTIELGVKIQNREYDFSSQYFSSNHYQWYQNLNKLFRAAIQADVWWKPANLKVGFDFEQRQNFLYFDSSGLPVQLSNGVNRFSFDVEQKLKLGKNFVWWNSVQYQKSNVDEWRLPAWSYRSRMYFEKYMFKGNMLGRIGVEAFFMSEFDGLAYNPITRRFQLNDKYSNGGYPMLDVFFNAKVNSMQLYIVLQHASEGFFGNDYYSSSTYPMMYRAIRLGVSWRLFN